jgi:hypothetical protein
MKLFIRTIFIMCAVLFFVLGSIALLHQSISAVTLHNYLKTHSYVFALCRYVVIILIISFWSKIIQWLCQHKKMDEALIHKLSRFRWQVLGFFIAMELLILLNHI